MYYYGCNAPTSGGKVKGSVNRLNISPWLKQTVGLEFWSFHWLRIPLNFGKTIKGNEQCWFSLTNSSAWCRQNNWLISTFIFHLGFWHGGNIIIVRCLLVIIVNPTDLRIESTGPKIKNYSYEFSTRKTTAYKKKEFLSWKWRTQTQPSFIFPCNCSYPNTLSKSPSTPGKFVQSIRAINQATFSGSGLHLPGERGSFCFTHKLFSVLNPRGSIHPKGEHCRGFFLVLFFFYTHLPRRTNSSKRTT